MPESFVDKYRKNCAPHSMFWHMNKDEQFLWHECNPNTKYALIRGCKGKKLYKVKCNICKRIFFMDSESFKCVKWQSCVGAKCLACVVNEEGIDYSKSLYAWDTEKNEIVETSTQLAVRQHIVVGANCISFSAVIPTRLCRIGMHGRLLPVQPQIVVALFDKQKFCF